MLVTPIEELYIAGICIRPGTLYRLTKENNMYLQKVYHEGVKRWVNTGVSLDKDAITSAITTNRLIVFSKSYESAIVKKTEKLKKEKAKMDYGIMQSFAQRVEEISQSIYPTNDWDASDLAMGPRGEIGERQ